MRQPRHPQPAAAQRHLRLATSQRGTHIIGKAVLTTVDGGRYGSVFHLWVKVDQGDPARFLRLSGTDQPPHRRLRRIRHLTIGHGHRAPGHHHHRPRVTLAEPALQVGQDRTQSAPHSLDHITGVSDACGIDDECVAGGHHRRRFQLPPRHLEH